MSLLGSQVYANPSTPIWVSAGSPASLVAPVAISGNAVSINATGQINCLSLNTSGAGGVVCREGAGGGFQILDATGAFLRSRVQHILAPAGATVIQSDDPVVFTRIGATQGNTSLTVSAFGANADLLTVGGTVSALNLELEDTGAAAVIGTATLTNGTETVNTTACDVTSYILLTRLGIGASTALGELRVSNQGANNFTVVSAQPATPASTETGDESAFHWMIVNAV